MSWLGSNLNLSESLSSITNITGQISTFTREMLTEGTEEVADPSAELNVARNRIRELEMIITSQKIEYDKLKVLNDELHERVEAAELQVRTMTQDYRERLALEEQEVINLKAELHNKEQQMSQMTPGHRQRHDSSDSQDEHEETKRLKNEIIRLQTECHQWKMMSSNQDSQEKLHREIDQYQHELVALQSTYSQKIANLNKKYKTEMQRWEEERQDYLSKIDDLEHELNILEEVDNLEGMQSEAVSSGSDLAALKEELELAHGTITELRLQGEKAVEFAMKKTSEIDFVQENLNRTTEVMKDTEGKLAQLQEKEKRIQEQDKKGNDVHKLQEQLLERENNLASLSNEINLLKEELQEVKAERLVLLDEKGRLQAEEQRLRESLTEVKHDVSLLSSSTLELMEELEHSQGVQQEQNYEINCLKKVCTVKGEAKEEIINLKNIVSALWERYVATLRLYQQVRHELHTSNHRLLAQLQARHANTQSVRQQVADVRTKLNTDTSHRQNRVQGEKDNLLAKSSELQSRIEEQESLVDDLRADNEQITQETKEMITEVGCQTANDSLDERNDVVGALEAEKSVLESTIVGLQSKVQDLKAEVRELKGEPIKADTSDFYYSEDTRSDLLGEATSGDKSTSTESLSLGAQAEAFKGKQDACDGGDIDKDAVIAQLNDQIAEYRSIIVEQDAADVGDTDKDAVIAQLNDQITEYQSIIEEREEFDGGDPDKDAVIAQLNDQISEYRAIIKEQDAADGGDTDKDAVIAQLNDQIAEYRSVIEDQEPLDGGDTDKDAVIAQLNDQISEYRSTIDEFEYIKADFEEEKDALERVVVDLRHQMKMLHEDAAKNKADKVKIQESGWENIDNSEVLDSLRNENEDLIKEKINLIKSLHALEEQLISSDIVQEDDMCGFETETERIEALVLNLKDWVIRTRAAERSDHDGSSMVNVSLNESSQTEEEYQQAKRAIEELEWDNSLLREQTNDLINRIEAKTTEVGLIQLQLVEKCSELNNAETEKHSLIKMINERDEKLSEIQDSFDSQLMDLTASRDNDVEILRSEQDGILQMLQERQKECETLRKTSNELMNSIHEKQESQDELSEENKSLVAHVHESEILLQDMRNEKENLLALLESKEQLVLSLSEETRSFTNEKSELSKLVQDYQEKLHNKDQELGNLSHLQFEVEQLGRQSKDNEYSRHSMEERIAALSGENEKLSTSLEEKELQLEHYRTELKGKTSEVEYLGVEMDRLNEVVGSNLAVRRDLERQVTSLKKKNEEFQIKIQEVESAVDSLKLDLREKGAENDLLRLDIVKVSRTLKEKEELLNNKAGMTGSLENQGTQGETQAQVARMLRLLQEKDQEILAMKQKEASLIAVVNQTDQTSHQALEHYQQQIQHLTGETNRLMEEVNQKDEVLFTMNDRLEVMQEQMQGKTQASSMLHSEHSRLMALNESQGNEIAKLREKIGSMVHRLEENEKHKHDEVQRIQEEIHQQSNVFKQEQERLMTLLQEKDKQIVALADATVPVAQTHVSSSASARELHEPSRELHVSSSAPAREVHVPSRELNENTRPSRELEEVIRQREALVAENDRSRRESELQQQNIAALEGELTSINHLLGERNDMLEKLSSENYNLHRSMTNVDVFLKEKSAMLESVTTEKENLQKSLEKYDTQLKESLGNASVLVEKDNRINYLEDELRTLRERLDSRVSELKLLQDSHENSKDALLHELEDIRLEKDEILHNKNKETNELRNKLLKALNTLGDCNFSFNSEGFTDVDRNFQSIVQRILNQRHSVLREKDNELRTLKDQISNLNVLQQSSPHNDNGLEEVIREKEMLNLELMRVQNEKEDILQEKESIVADLQGQIIALTKLVGDKERSMTLDVEKINREKERTEKELDKLRTEKENLHRDLSERDREVSTLRSEADRVLGLVAEEKSNSARLQGDVEQYRVLLQEKESRLGELIMEREQLGKNSDMMEQKVSQLQGELVAASGGQRDTEAKMARELDRLRAHLIQVEESYTREALGAEEREKELRLRFAQAEEQLLSSSHSMQDRNRHANQQLESLQEQLHALSGQRDDAVMQLAAVQEQAQQYATSLDNLQMVLEQFQREKDAQLYAIQEHAQHQVDASRAEVKQLQQKQNELQGQLQNASKVVHEIGNLRQELAARDQAITQYRAEAAKLEEELQVCHTRIRNMNSNSDNKVDKALLKNLLMAYFHTAEAKRPDVIHVIGGLLAFTIDEMKEIGSGSHPPNQGGWISSLLPFGGPPRSPVTKKPPLDAMHKSFTELFVNFLEHESDAAQTPLQTRRGGTTSNPLLTGLTPQATPLSSVRAGDRPPLASSTPIRPPTMYPMTTGSSSAAAPSPLVTGHVRPPMTSVPPVAMPTGSMSPIVPPGGVRDSVPVPVGPLIRANVSSAGNPRPQGAQSSVTNPLLVGHVTAVQQLPAISSSTPSSSLRNVLFQSLPR